MFVFVEPPLHQTPHVLAELLNTPTVGAHAGRSKDDNRFGAAVASRLLDHGRSHLRPIHKESLPGACKSDSVLVEFIAYRTQDQGKSRSRATPPSTS
ncbi:hypothetical protein HBI56_224030 [Parastagonospora nodorum]|uniref:Uncharacterized protein n=2 Tax=Phaeosphaeria nodorum (strain SN15 / ATCC MYA-4574 / FGSC 10173) TaxID=321614 RepID=A0A7U2HZ50_PHANO|nr:hypothetical protein SNOG_07284 [Parastagonospora nodorum SN15]KAH3910086.1 hypothetical protein HBH56_146960 [Parastagonospora nodorum]EAT84750.1 hypothetical protein SNOG_07284 [Parastagonospora nodorum SN15]KAH3923335.1 hypothetical protein HBH54_211600 [Parastagonospora nodorum]KAH3945927.1 hypothetical protein HBH53_134410 [Parastagonospora nodorum]KAH3983697.1 hypothetical protein HBH52_065620 [Parastagonospora nodorum]